MGETEKTEIGRDFRFKPKESIEPEVTKPHLELTSDNLDAIADRAFGPADIDNPDSSVMPTGLAGLEFGQLPAAHLERTTAIPGEKTGAVKIERGRNAAPEALDMGIKIPIQTENFTEQSPALKKSHEEELVDITNRNIETIQTKLREDAKMPLGTREIYEEVLKNNLQKLEQLTNNSVKKTVAKNRGLTMEKINADSNRHQQTAEEKAILYEKAKPSSDIRVPAADQDWAARATKFRGYKEKDIRDVHAADHQKKQDKQLGGEISADEIAWFNKDKTETLTRTPDAPAEDSFLAKLNRLLTGR
ncbi:TPA: hypothetical protein DEP96_00985 [Candidatus Uhrbacteria bacterium]|nr:hypothetical protein [Candidatus Uhrbacteria bacterium]